MYFTDSDGCQLSPGVARKLGYANDQGPDVNEPDPDDNGNGEGEEEGDCSERLEALERAVAMLIEGNGSEQNLSGQEPNNTDAYEDPTQQLASKMVQGGDQRRFTTGGAKDALPDISDINAKNKAFYQKSSQGVSAMGSPEATPAPSAEMKQDYPSAGPDPKRLSRTTATLDPGKVMGAQGGKSMTADMTKFWRDQRLRTNNVVNSINARNAAHYGR